jgi:hypothetical protein
MPAGIPRPDRGSSDLAPGRRRRGGAAGIIEDAACSSRRRPRSRAEHDGGRAPALRKLDALLADNSDSLHSAIANLNTFTAALARNPDRVDGILTGLEHMAGTGAPKATPVAYDLTAPGSFPPPEQAAKSRFVIPEPTTLVTLDTQKIIVDPGAGEPPDNARSSDHSKAAPGKNHPEFRGIELCWCRRPADGRTCRGLSASDRSSQFPDHWSAGGAAAALDVAFGKAVASLVTWSAGVM